MTQNWVGQAVSSLNIKTVWDRKLFMKSWNNSKRFWEYIQLFVCDFLYLTVPKPLDHNVSIFLVSKI